MIELTPEERKMIHEGKIYKGKRSLVKRWWKKFLQRKMIQREMKLEVEQIMREVNAGPNLQNVEAPPGMYDELMEKIREYERAKAEVVSDILGKIDKALAELEEELLQERIESDPELKGQEISPELREELLEEIREKYQNLEE